MAGNKRELFLTVGEQLFGRYGYRDVNIEDITREAGVGTGTFYTYFPSKEAFYEEILETLESRGREEVDRLVAGFDSPLTKLKALYRFTTLGIRRNPILLGILTRDRKYIYPGQQSRLAGEKTLRQHVERVIGDIIRQGQQARLLRTRSFRDPTRLLLALYDAILLNLHGERVEELMNDALLLVERGLRRRIRLRPMAGGRERRRQQREDGL
jgi:AcrR family transcriptional regulator